MAAISTKLIPGIRGSLAGLSGKCICFGSFTAAGCTFQDRLQPFCDRVPVWDGPKLLSWPSMLRSEVLACESVSHFDGGIKKESVRVTNEISQTTRPSLDFIPERFQTQFAALCWMLVMGIWLAAVAGPFYVLYCAFQGAWDSLLTFLCGWLVCALVKFPHIPWLAEVIASGIESWFPKFSISYEQSLERSKTSLPTGRTLYCYHPHGLFSIGAALLAVDLIRRGEKVSFVVASHMRWFNPVAKLLMDLAGIEIVGASAKDVQEAMKRGDRSLILVPGGYEEAVMTKTGFERLFLRNRLGFVKYAMRYGYSIKPVYAYGENDMYTTLDVLPSVRDWLAGFKIPIVFFYGDAKVPILPLRNEAGLKLVVGAAVAVAHSSEPSLRQLRDAHSEYVEKVAELYYRYNQNSDRPLEIV